MRGDHQPARQNLPNLLDTEICHECLLSRANRCTPRSTPANNRGAPAIVPANWYWLDHGRLSNAPAAARSASAGRAPCRPAATQCAVHLTRASRQTVCWPKSPSAFAPLLSRAVSVSRPGRPAPAQSTCRTARRSRGPRPRTGQVQDLRRALADLQAAEDRLVGIALPDDVDVPVGQVDRGAEEDGPSSDPGRPGRRAVPALDEPRTAHHARRRLRVAALRRQPRRCPTHTTASVATRREARFPRERMDGSASVGISETESSGASLLTSVHNTSHLERHHSSPCVLAFTGYVRYGGGLFHELLDQSNLVALGDRPRKVAMRTMPIRLLESSVKIVVAPYPQLAPDPQPKEGGVGTRSWSRETHATMGPKVT